MTYSSDDDRFDLSGLFSSRLIIGSLFSGTRRSNNNRKTVRNSHRVRIVPVCKLDITPVLLKYESAEHYRNVFKPLIVAEAEDEEKNEKQKIIENVKLTWANPESTRLAILPIPDDKAEELKLKSGIKILIRCIGIEYETWEAEGKIYEVPKENNEHVFKVEICSDYRPSYHTDQKVSVSLVWNDTRVMRMISALDKLAVRNRHVSENISDILLGSAFQHKISSVTMPDTYVAESLPRLNKYQIEAVKNSLEQSLTLIQGPPGTGKTVVSATIVYLIVKYNPLDKLLVCASSNVAVDNLAEKLCKTGLKTVRICAKTIQKEYRSVSFPTLHGMIQEIKDSKCKKDYIIPESNWATEFTNYYLNEELLEYNILKKADVILSTCIGSGDQNLEDFKFHTVLIDEATQATEPESLIPIMKGCQRLILVGDHKQLGPVVVDDEAKKAGFNQSLFERLIKLNYPVNMLQLQFRMHPSISKFPSTTFYDDQLLNGITAQDRTNYKNHFHWPNNNFPIIFYTNQESESKPEKGFSFLNHYEAVKCLDIIERLIKYGAKPEEIGVITFYDGQRYYISKMLNKRSNPQSCSKIDVASVDAFQGREKDYIIISCVRSNITSNIGFLYEPRRLNVALTRAKMGLFIVGNPRTLHSNPLWQGLLKHIQNNDALVEGPIDCLQPSSTSVIF